MPQIKSQEKRVRTNRKRTKIAKSRKTSLKNAIKRVNLAVKNQDLATAEVALQQVYHRLDASVTSNIHHQNYANRHKARLSQLVNQLKKVEA